MVSICCEITSSQDHHHILKLFQIHGRTIWEYLLHLGLFFSSWVHISLLKKKEINSLLIDNQFLRD